MLHRCDCGVRKPSRFSIIFHLPNLKGLACWWVLCFFERLSPLLRRWRPPAERAGWKREEGGGPRGWGNPARGATSCALNVAKPFNVTQVVSMRCGVCPLSEPCNPQSRNAYTFSQRSRFMTSFPFQPQIAQPEFYTAEEHAVWKTLFQRQVHALDQHGSRLFVRSLKCMGDALTGAQVPRIEDLSRVLERKTGWRIAVVPGLIPVEDFFQLLSQRMFCTSTWVRKRSQLDYLDEPDMFHDSFGHLPPLTQPDFANFMQRLGQIGVAVSNDSTAITQLQRLYWFVVEFGLVTEWDEFGMPTPPRIFGAGIASSFSEIRRAESMLHAAQPYHLPTIMNLPFATDQLQTTYFVVRSWSEVARDLEAWFTDWQSAQRPDPEQR